MKLKKAISKLLTVIMTISLFVGTPAASVKAEETGPGPIPNVFTSTNIGPAGIPGSATYDSRNNEFNVTGSGLAKPASPTDPDGLQFVGLNTMMTGDSTIIAKVRSFDIGGASKPTIGVMVRTSLDPASNFAASIIEPDASSNGSAASYTPYYEYRDAAQGKLTTISGNASAVTTAADGSFYLKLAYQGSTVQPGDTSTAAYYIAYIGMLDSSGNINWTRAKSTSTKSAVSNSYYIGLAVSSNDPTQSVTANFDNVTIENTYDTSDTTPLSKLDGMGVPVWAGNGKVTPAVSANGDVTLAWTGAAFDNFGVNHYNIYEGSNLVGQTSDASATSFTVTKAMVSGIDPSYDPTTKAYTFSVQAVDAAGSVSTDGPGTSSDIVPPTWTSGTLNADMVTQNSVNVSWSGASDNTGVTNYKIYDVTKDANPVLVAAVDGRTTSYSITKLRPSTSYKFQVEAGDSSNNWSTDGPVLSVTTTAPIVDTQAPEWPSGQLSASNVSQTGLTLTWSEADDNVGVRGYDLYEGSNIIATLSNTQNTYNVTGLVPSTTYKFTVQAEDQAGNKSTDGPSLAIGTPQIPTWQSGKLTWSNKITAQPDSEGPVYDAVQKDSATLTWSGAADSVGITGYNILQDGKLVAAVDGSTSSYTVLGLTPGTTHNYKVEAFDNAGCVSNDGPAVTIAMPAEDSSLQPPENLSVPTLAYDDTSITLVWQKPDNYAQSDIANYNVYMDGKLIGDANHNTASAAQPFVNSFYAANSSAVKVSSHTFIVTGLKPDTTYNFTVRSVDSLGHESADSNTVTQATTAAPQVFDVTNPKYGAVGEGNTLDTAAIQAAIDACTPGGKVVLPAGKTFKSGALYIKKSDITFEVDGKLIASDNAADFPYPDPTHNTVTKSDSLINVIDPGLENIKFTGTGTIDGNGWMQDIPGADGLPVSLESNSGTVDTNGILAKSQYELAKSWGFSDEDAYSIRSNLMTIDGATNVYFGGGLSLVNPSMHTLSVNSNNVTLNNIKILTFNDNNADGIDMGGNGLTVINSIFDTGDDDINFSAGVGAAAEQGPPVQNIYVFDNYFRHGHGALAAGSHTASWIENIIYEDNVMDGIGVGLRCKTGPGVGGGARNIMFRDSAVKDVSDGDEYPFEFTSAYPSTAGDPAPDTGRFEHIFVNNVSIDESSKSSIFVSGKSDAYDSDLHFTDVSFNNTPATNINYLKNSSFDNVTFTNVVNGANPWVYANTLGLVFMGASDTSSSVDTSNNRKIDVWDFGGLQQSGDQYNNNLTPAILDNTPTIKSGSFVTTSFGDLTIANPDLKDRMYYNEADGTTNGVNSMGYTGYQKASYSDGYNANGIYYCNGTAGNAKRFLTIDNVTAGDRISVYAGLSSGTLSQIHFVHAAVSISGTKVTVTPDTVQPQDSSVNIYSTTAAERADFVAQYSGSYQIYVTAVGKPVFNRVVRIPGVNVNGKVNLNGYNVSSGYSLEFVNKTTGQTTDVNVNSDNTFNAVLAPGFDYTATLVGASDGYVISDDTKIVTVSTSDIADGIKGIKLDVAYVPPVNVSGYINGFDDSYDVSNLQVTLNPPQGSLASPVTAAVDTQSMTYNAAVQKGVQYTVALSGVNDYEISSGGTIDINTDAAQNITVSKKPVYTASGKFTGLPSTAQITGITFTNVADGYTYDGTVADGGYTVSLRDGAYSVNAVCTENYSTSFHIVVSGQNTTKDILFDDNTAPGPLSWVSDLYVGDSTKTNNYSTVKDALAAAARMNPTSEAQRITIHIAPGTYRAQLVISTPYITLVNSDPSKEVKITWYYGFGYDYYSVGADGFYNADNAADKYSKGNVSSGEWGSSVYLTSAAAGFRAENITFENSFNKYVTPEEIADGVSLSTNFPQSVSSSITDRTVSGFDPTQKKEQERATAMAITSDNVEFSNCKFIGQQDTLYTGGSGTSNEYFNNCFIEGNTDFIFGDGNVIFDNSTLNLSGYSDASQAGYITAAKDTAAYGYLFRNSIITASRSNQAPSFFGRPWGPKARVTFENTKLQSPALIDPAGWTSMSGALPQNANFAEYNTTYNDAPVDTTNRAVAPLTDTSSIASVDKYLGGDWTPEYYSPKQITSVDTPADVNVIEGLTPALPALVKAHYDIGTTGDVAVKWDNVDTSKAGTISVHGTVAGFDAGVTINVIVAPKQITSVDAPSDVNVLEGMVPVLPKTVTAHYNNNTAEEVAVTWDAVDTSKVGTAAVHGLVAGFDAGVTVNVIVAPKQITSVDTPEDINVVEGQTPVLPKTVTVHYNNNTVSELPVTWGTVDTSKIGVQQTIEGTVEGYSSKVTVKVTIEKPAVLSTNDLEQLESVLKNSGDKAFTVDVNSASPVVTSSVLDAIKGQDKTITFVNKAADGTVVSSWSFNGMDINKDISNLDLTVNFTSPIQSEIEKAADGKDISVISFKYHGDLPGKATIKVKVDSAWLNGKDKNNLSLYYYNPDTKSFELIAQHLAVDTEGYVQINITHCSDYVLVDGSQSLTGQLVKTGSLIDMQEVVYTGLMLILCGAVLLVLKRRNGLNK